MFLFGHVILLWGRRPRVDIDLRQAHAIPRTTFIKTLLTEVKNNGSSPRLLSDTTVAKTNTLNLNTVKSYLRLVVVSNLKRCNKFWSVCRVGVPVRNQLRTNFDFEGLLLKNDIDFSHN